ncbi:MAG TPA: tetratricopeptide repeat protein, partial [Candidatus Aminicenantes bacterium]|nr:tetratricopeptide repeat protein [Candidatus Aminicenantes bacterium]
QTLEKQGHLYLAAVFLIQGVRPDTDPQSLYPIYLQLGRILALLPGEDLDAITHHFPRFASAPELLAEVEHNAPDYNDRREAAMLTADALRSLGRSTGAMEHLMRFLGRTRDPVVEQVFQHRFDEFMAQARQEGRYANFLRLWASLEDWKSYLTGPQLLSIGETLLSLDLIDKAVEVFSFLRRYQLYRGVWDEAGKGLIRAMFTKGEWADCLALIETGTSSQLVPEGEFLYYRLRCAEKLGRSGWQETLRQIEPPKTCDRFDLELQLMRGELFVRENRIGQAIEVYLAVDRMPDLAPERRRAVAQRLADLYYLGGDLAKALPAYRRLDEIGGESDWSLYQQILTLHALGRKEEADRTEERLKTRYPQSPWTKRTP